MKYKNNSIVGVVGGGGGGGGGMLHGICVDSMGKGPGARDTLSN